MLYTYLAAETGRKDFSDEVKSIALAHNHTRHKINVCLEIYDDFIFEANESSSNC